MEIAGSMEIAGAKKVFGKSEAKHNLYTLHKVFGRR